MAQHSRGPANWLELATKKNRPAVQNMGVRAAARRPLLTGWCSCLSGNDLAACECGLSVMAYSSATMGRGARLCLARVSAHAHTHVTGSEHLCTYQLAVSFKHRQGVAVESRAGYLSHQWVACLNQSASNKQVGYGRGWQAAAMPSVLALQLQLKQHTCPAASPPPLHSRCLAPTNAQQL